MQEHNSPHTHAVLALVASIPVSPLEMGDIELEPCVSPSTAIEARVVSPSATALVVSQIPPRVHADRPLEIKITAIGVGTLAPRSVTDSVARFLSTHASLEIAIDAAGRPLVSYEVPLSVRSSDSGGEWIARALVRPSAWADAATVTVVALTLVGHPLPFDSLPATLRVSC